jgi:transposase-like protein
MKQLSQEAKQTIVEKALTSNEQSIREIAVLHNVGYSTLQKWMRKHRASHSATNIPQMASQLTAAERFQHLMATASLDEIAIGAYCRQQGLYSHQLEQWKEAFMKQSDKEKKQQQQSEIKALRAENKLLKQDLRRKEKALAETTALLVLKKKAALIWGEPEDVA